MNRRQRIILIATACAVALMVIFPPYIVESAQGLVRMVGYGFILNLPSYTVPGGIYSYGYSIPAIVNANTLLVQIAGAIAAGGLTFLSAKS